MKTMSEEYTTHVQCVRCFQRLNKGFEVGKNQPAQPVNFPQPLQCCWCGGPTYVQIGAGWASQGYQIRDHIARVPCQGRGGVHGGQ